MQFTNNRELVLNLQNDNRDAFNSIYWKYHSAIYYNILKVTKDELFAEDLVQEVFTTLWTKRHGLDPDKEIAGWLFVVSSNKSITHLKQKLKTSLSEKNILSPLGEEADHGNQFTDDMLATLEKAIDKLSPQKRKVFELCKLEGKTYLETATVLGISKHTVKEYLSASIISVKLYIKQHPELAVFIFYSVL